MIENENNLQLVRGNTELTETPATPVSPQIPVTPSPVAATVSAPTVHQPEEIPYIGPPRVLIVEDEPSICRALNIALTRAGYDVTTAQTGEVATALLQHRRFDLLVLDFRMPDMKGDVICHLAVSYQPHLLHRTLFITGDITDKAIKIMEACNCPVLYKPFELTELVGFLREMYPQYIAIQAKK